MKEMRAESPRLHLRSSWRLLLLLNLVGLSIFSIFYTISNQRMIPCEAKALTTRANIQDEESFGSSTEGEQNNQQIATKSSSESANLREALNNFVPQRSDIAYVTLLGSSSFIPGAMAMMQALKDVGTQLDRVVLHTRDISPEVVRSFHSAGIRTKWVDYIDNPTSDEVFKKYTYSSKRYWVTYTKLRAWEMVEYRKVIIIDCDVYPMKNLDDLQDAATPSATMVVQTPNLLNPALMVISPSTVEFQNILNKTKTIQSQDGGELGFFEKYYPKPWSINRLPKEYLWDVLKPFPRGYLFVKSFHMFFKKPVLKTAEKIWLIKPPKLEDALRIRYLRDTPYERKRYSFFLNVTSLFWQSYHRFWRHTDLNNTTLLKTHALAGAWGINNITKMYVRQHLGRLLVIIPDSANPWIGEGYVDGSSVLFHFQSLHDGKDAYFGARLATSENKSLSLILDKGAHRLIGSHLDQAHDSPPVPLQSEIPLAGFWKTKRGRVGLMLEAFGFLVLMMFEVDSKAHTSVHNPVGSAKQELNLEDVSHKYYLEGMYFFHEGHTTAEAIHGTYLIGNGVYRTNPSSPLILESKAIAFQLNDHHELIPLNPEANLHLGKLQKLDFSPFSGSQKTTAHNIARELNRFATVHDQRKLWLQAFFSLEGDMHSEKGRTDQMQNRAQVVTTDHRGFYRGCLRCLWEPIPTFNHISIGQKLRRIVLHERRPLVSLTRFGMGYADDSGVTLEWFEYGDSSTYWPHLVRDREILHVRLDDSVEVKDMQHHIINQGKSKATLICDDESRVTKLVKQRPLDGTQSRVAQHDGDLVSPDLRPGMWSGRKGSVYFVQISAAKDRLYLVGTNNYANQSPWLLGSGPLSHDGTKAHVRWMEWGKQAAFSDEHPQQLSGVFCLAWSDGTWSISHPNTPHQEERWTRVLQPTDVEGGV